MDEENEEDKKGDNTKEIRKKRSTAETKELCDCPVMKQGKAQLFKISCSLLCSNPGGCMALRNLFDP